MKEVRNLLEDLRGTTKVKEKANVLFSYNGAVFLYLAKATYHPFLHFNVKLTKKLTPPPGNRTIEEIFGEVCEVFDFCLRTQSPKQNKEKIVELLSKLDSKSQELIICTLNKNWKAGVGVKTLLTVYEDFVPVFDVQLANKHNEVKLKKTYKPKTWLASPKLDGVRCVFLREKDEWRVYSRQGNEFLTLDHIKEDLEEIYHERGYTFWDGEIYKHGIPFAEIQGAVTAFTRGTAEWLQYHTFICGYAEDFWEQRADRMRRTAGMPGKYIVPVPQKPVEEDEIQAYLEECFEQGYEGIMLRDPNELYSFGRGNQLLKLKEGEKDKKHEQEEQEADCIVEDIEYKDDFPVVKDGKIVFKRLLNKIWVRQHTHNDKWCKVGSGFDLDFRHYYTLNPEELLGKVVEIKFQDYGSKGLMRFPRYKRIREDLME
jgi:ATP-dependent DNA ligase